MKTEQCSIDRGARAAADGTRRPSLELLSRGALGCDASTAFRVRSGFGAPVARVFLWCAGIFLTSFVAATEARGRLAGPLLMLRGRCRSVRWQGDLARLGPRADLSRVFSGYPHCRLSAGRRTGRRFRMVWRAFRSARVAEHAGAARLTRSWSRG